MFDQPDYEVALSKGERFFERGNFLLAKRELEIAQRLRPSDALADKLRQCMTGIEIQNAKEAVKKGRKLEKKGKLVAALEQFEQAWAISPEDWMPQKIEQLRQQIGYKKVVATIEQAEHAGDLSSLLATYEQTLTTQGLSDTDRQTLYEKKLIALVRLERYNEAQVWAQEHPPHSASACYHLGYAKAATGAYLNALYQWVALPLDNPVLRQQLMALLPLAYHEARRHATDLPVDLYERLLPLLKYEVTLEPLLAHFKLFSVDSLWHQEKYQEAAHYLLPLPRQLSLPELGLYARLMLQLAEEDVESLRNAISLWLTAIYNTPLLERLISHRVLATPLHWDTLRKALQQELEDVIDRHDREGRLDKRLQRHYRTEKRVIEALADWSLPHDGTDVWPCTPMFAARFGLSKTVLERIEAWRERDAWDESILTIAVYFSASGHSLLLAEAGAVDEALLELPKAALDDRLGRYCRQRVAWLCGIELALAGNSKGKSYLTEALPLLVDFPHYRKELIDIALGELPIRKRLGLAEAMEWLARQFDDAKFREATAILLCKKAVFFANEGNAKTVYKRLLDQAMTLCPDCYLVKDTYAQFEQVQYHEQLDKALSKGKLGSAVAVIERSARDEELLKHFFSVLNNWFNDIESSDRKPQVHLSSLRELLFYARQADPAHPLNSAISAALRRIEK